MSFFINKRRVKRSHRKSKKWSFNFVVMHFLFSPDVAFVWYPLKSWHRLNNPKQRPDLIKFPRKKINLEYIINIYKKWRLIQTELTLLPVCQMEVLVSTIAAMEKLWCKFAQLAYHSMETYCELVFGRSYLPDFLEIYW